MNAPYITHQTLQCKLNMCAIHLLFHNFIRMFQFVSLYFFFTVNTSQTIKVNFRGERIIIGLLFLMIIIKPVYYPIKWQNSKPIISLYYFTNLKINRQLWCAWFDKLPVGPCYTKLVSCRLFLFFQI